MQVPQHHEAVPITSLSGAPQESLSGNTLVQTVLLLMPPQDCKASTQARGCRSWRFWAVAA